MDDIWRSWYSKNCSRFWFSSSWNHHGKRLWFLLFSFPLEVLADASLCFIATRDLLLEFTLSTAQSGSLSIKLVPLIRMCLFLCMILLVSILVTCCKFLRDVLIMFSFSFNNCSRSWCCTIYCQSCKCASHFLCGGNVELRKSINLMPEFPFLMVTWMIVR